MRVHLVTSCGASFPYDALADLRWNATLISYAYKNKLPFFTIVWNASAPDNHVIVDSGAFSAWSSGQTINLDGFMRWGHVLREEHGSACATLRFVNLDVIPGKRGKPATLPEIERGMTASLHNADRMRAEGFDLIEVYHQSEPTEFLDHLLARAPPGALVAVSPDNGTSLQERKAFLLRTLRHLLKTREPADLPRTHGLGVTALDLTSAFPFYSVDSSSWNLSIRFGAPPGTGLPYLPRYADGGALTSRLVVRREAEKVRDLQHRVTRLWRDRGVTWSD